MPGKWIIGIGVIVLTFAALIVLHEVRWSDPAYALRAGRESRMVAQCTIRYPFDQSVLPPELLSPRFVWQDWAAGVTKWMIGFFVADSARPFFSAMSPESHWRPSITDWEAIKKHGAGKKIQIRVAGISGPPLRKVVSFGSVGLIFSTDSVSSPIFYREVNLPFAEAVKDPSRIRWRFGTIDMPAGPPVVLENLPVCGNCHSFSAAGTVLGMDVDYANDKGSYAIAPVQKDILLDKSKIITWMDYRRNDGEFTFGLLSRVSPTGRFVASTVKDRSVFVPKPDIAFSQLFFPVKGIIAVYNQTTGTYTSLPGANDPDYVQSNPIFSPDEKSLLFIRSPVYLLKTNSNSVLLSESDCSEFVEDKKPFKYDIYHVPFNDGKGGDAVALPGASQNGKSNYFPCYSPDGRWIVFCQSENYSLLQPDSRLYMLPSSGGIPRLMRCNLGRMNSWHSFSPDGKWMVFSSKAFSDYTQLFLAHVGEDGMDAPPVLLEHFTAADRAANIPEFVNVSPGAIDSISERFLDDFSFVRAAQEPMRTGDIAGAIERYRTAIALNPNNGAAHYNLAFALEETGDVDGAEAEYRQAIASDPAIAMSYNNLANILVRRENDSQAESLYVKALKLDSTYADPHFNLGVLLARNSRLREAADHFATAVRLNPGWVEAIEKLGDAHLRLGRLDHATSAFQAALKLDSSSVKSKAGLSACSQK